MDNTNSFSPIQTAQGTTYLHQQPARAYPQPRHEIVHEENLINGITANEVERNPVVLITVCVLLGLYLSALIICLWYDNRDKKQDVGVTIMADLTVKGENSHFYLITVVTGCNFWAGTTSAIGLVIYGSEGRSKVYTLKDGTNTVCLRGDVDTFLVSSDKDLGNLEKIRIWTDNSGPDPAWYCRKILIRSVGAKIWHFYVNSWLDVSTEEDIILEIPATSKEDRHLFGVRFRENLLDQIDNANLWSSIFRFSPASSFTRCQRLTSAFAVLSVDLFVDIWFHGTPKTFEGESFGVGRFSIDLFSIVRGLEIAAISVPIGFILVTLFRNVRERYTPTIIVWENVVPATTKLKRTSLFIPLKENELLGGGNKKNVHHEGFSPSVSEAPSTDEDIKRHIVVLSTVDRDKFDSPSKASTTASEFAIPSTNVPKLEGWIEDRAHKEGLNYGSKSDGGGQKDHKKTTRPPKSYPFVQSVDNEPTIGQTDSEREAFLRLSRHAMINSIRDFNPDSFMFSGDQSVAELEKLIDKQLEEAIAHVKQGKHHKETQAALESLANEKGKGEKEIVLGKNKKETLKEKTPWKKAVTSEYLQNIDETLAQEQQNRLFMQNKDNWDKQTALEMCRLLVDFRRPSCFSWPWWLVYLAWGVCLSTIATCLFFTVLFGIHYGYIKSLHWLEAIGYSVLFSAFVVQPLNTLLTAVFITLIGVKRKVRERVQVIIEDSDSTAQYLASRLEYKFNVFKPERTCEPPKNRDHDKFVI